MDNATDSAVVVATLPKLPSRSTAFNQPIRWFHLFRSLYHAWYSCSLKYVSYMCPLVQWVQLFQSLSTLAWVYGNIIDPTFAPLDTITESMYCLSLSALPIAHCLHIRHRYMPLPLLGTASFAVHYCMSYLIDYLIHQRKYIPSSCRRELYLLMLAAHSVGFGQQKPISFHKPCRSF